MFENATGVEPLLPAKDFEACMKNNGYNKSEVLYYRSQFNLVCR